MIKEQNFKPKLKIMRWLSICGIAIGGTLLVQMNKAHATFGEDIPFLIQIITQTIKEIQELSTIVSAAENTASVLQEMNQGVKEVLRLADTAHIPLPPQVYAQARDINQAAELSSELYGVSTRFSPRYSQYGYRSGVEGLFLSQDAFDYSAFLDEQGRRIKSAAIIANEPAATKLTAESMGVLIQSVDQTNRIQAKGLEITSTQNIEASSKENARLESFRNTEEEIEAHFQNTNFSSLPPFGVKGGDQ